MKRIVVGLALLALAVSSANSRPLVGTTFRIPGVSGTWKCTGDVLVNETFDELVPTFGREIGQDHSARIYGKQKVRKFGLPSHSGRYTYRLERGGRIEQSLREHGLGWLIRNDRTIVVQQMLFGDPVVGEMGFRPRSSVPWTYIPGYIRTGDPVLGIPNVWPAGREPSPDVRKLTYVYDPQDGWSKWFMFVHFVVVVAHPQCANPDYTIKCVFTRTRVPKDYTPQQAEEITLKVTDTVNFEECGAEKAPCPPESSPFLPTGGVWNVDSHGRLTALCNGALIAWTVSSSSFGRVVDCIGNPPTLLGPGGPTPPGTPPDRPPHKPGTPGTGN